ncbi:MAG: hypothetical protein QW318_06455 [Candidatus Caldarchaeum sp.]
MKIEENPNEKTPYFISHDAKIVIEVKSINDLENLLNWAESLMKLCIGCTG